MFGISKEIYLEITKIANKYSNYNFYIFGSRARGDYKYNSDIDIAIEGNITEEEEMNIKNDFDLLDIEYTIDIVIMYKIEKKELLEAIQKEGIKIK